MATAVALASPLRRLLHSPCPHRAIPTPLHFSTRGRCDVAPAVSAAAVRDSSTKGSMHRHVTEEVMSVLDMPQAHQEKAFNRHWQPPRGAGELPVVIDRGVPGAVSGVWRRGLWRAEGAAVPPQRLGHVAGGESLPHRPLSPLLLRPRWEGRLLPAIRVLRLGTAPP